LAGRISPADMTTRKRQGVMPWIHATMALGAFAVGR